MSAKDALEEFKSGTDWQKALFALRKPSDSPAEAFLDAAVAEFWETSEEAAANLIEQAMPWAREVAASLDPRAKQEDLIVRYGIK